MKPTSQQILIVNKRLKEIKNEVLRRKHWSADISQAILAVDSVTKFGLVTYKASVFSHRKNEKPLSVFSYVSCDFRIDRYFDEHILREFAYQMFDDLELRIINQFFTGKTRKQK